MSLKQISVFVENKPGTLHAMARALAAGGIDMRAFSQTETTDFGIARIIVDDVFRTVDVLRGAGFVCSVTPVLGVVIPDSPGGLCQVLSALAAENINVEYLYAFPGSSRTEGAVMIFRVNDVDKAAVVLGKNGIRLLEADGIQDS